MKKLALILTLLASPAVADNGMGIPVPNPVPPTIDFMELDAEAVAAWRKCLFSLGTNCAEWRAYRNG